MDITERLFECADEKYADFQAKLTPSVNRSLFIGVRVPDLRRMAKELYGAKAYEGFLTELPHTYFDENMLHGLILSEFKDYDACILGVDGFLPFVDNWAVCDSMSPKCFRKHKDSLIGQAVRWSQSDETYTVRFGLKTLMTHFLDEDFRPEYLQIPVKVRPDGYYVRMMIAWFYATALAKQWDAAVPYVENGVFGPWIHNRIIQKARESYRISDRRKEYLKTLKKNDPEVSGQ